MPSPKHDKRTFKEIIEVSGCCGYIAAPITVQGRAIGMLHADRPEPDGVVTMDHLDQLEAFAECLAVAFESAVLEEKATQQHVEVENLCANVDELLRRSARSALWSLSGCHAGTATTMLTTVASYPPLPSLTAREREIMSYVATGATNGQIARCLVISEGTVKSHLKHIAKKLNTSSRAAAVAVYAGIAHRWCWGVAMNTHAMVARLNELDEQLCSAFGIPRSSDATTLDEAIAMSAATTDDCWPANTASATTPRHRSRRVPLTDIPAGAGRSASDESR